MAWLGDGATKERVLALAALMPPAARAAIDDSEHDGWAIIQSVLDGFIDTACRATLIREEMTDTIDGRDPTDVQIAWLSGLLGEEHAVRAVEPTRSEMTRRIRRWVGSLEEQGQSTTWRLLLRLNEPLEEALRLRVPRTIDRGTWCWAEFISARPCTDSKELGLYYRRMGTLLAILHTLQGNDFHLENVIAHGPHPVPIDLETVCVPDNTPPGQEASGGARSTGGEG